MVYILYFYSTSRLYIAKHEKNDRKDHTPPVGFSPRLIKSSEGSPDSGEQPLKDITLPRRPTVEHEIGIITASPRGRNPMSKTTTTTTTSTGSTATAAAVIAQQLKMIWLQVSNKKKYMEPVQVVPPK